MHQSSHPKTIVGTAEVQLTPLEENPWLLVFLERTKSKISSTIQSFGFVRYERPELRVNVDPFTPAAVMEVLATIAKAHMYEAIEEGVFICEDITHPTGESWRFLARKCSQASLHAASEFFINTYAGLGSPQSDDFYRLGILDMIFSDADNLLPGEPGYDAAIDIPMESITFH